MEDRTGKSYRELFKKVTISNDFDFVISSSLINQITKLRPNGKTTMELVENCKKELGSNLGFKKWNYKNETVIFQNSKSQLIYDKLLNKVIQDEETVNELSDKLVR